MDRPYFHLPLAAIAAIRWRRVLAFGLLSLALLFLVTFAVVDQLVAHRLARAKTSEDGTVYSDVIQIVPHSRLSVASYLKRIKERSYSQVEHSPTSEGEFSVKNGVIEIRTRSFRTADGRFQSSTLASIAAGSDGLRVVSSTTNTPIFLEPIPLARLGNSPLRHQTTLHNTAIPPALLAAFVAIEDERFYSHWGLDPIGIARALVRNLVAGRIVEGGSTITQQLAKNLLLTRAKTFGRKFIEALAALSLELRLTKDEILERYLNEVFFLQEGNAAIHGVAAASEALFDKPPSELTVGECALLAGLVQAPTTYSPRRHPERSLERRNVVLKKMLDSGMIDPGAYESAVAERLAVAPPRVAQHAAPHFVARLERDLTSEFGSAALNKIVVHTGIDTALQRCAAEAVKGTLARIYPEPRRKRAIPEAALVAIEPHSGLVRAWVGSRDFSRNQFDHVADAKRQIGSTIKPFLYLTALDAKRNSYRVATAVSVLGDDPPETTTRLGGATPWRPQNYDRRFRGDVTLRYALERSLNLPAVYVLERVGEAAFTATLLDFRLANAIEPLPSLALGALDTSLLRLTAAYGGIANGGLLQDTRLYRSVGFGQPREVYHSQNQSVVVTDEGTAFLLTDMLRGVVSRGTGVGVRRGGFRGEAAGKTGTSDGGRDAWFVGYTPRLVAGTWVGFDDNRTSSLTGSNSAALIWGAFMACAAEYVEPAQFIAPPSTVERIIDTRCFGVATGNTPDWAMIREIFVRGTEPREECEPDAEDLYRNAE